MSGCMRSPGSIDFSQRPNGFLYVLLKIQCSYHSPLLVVLIPNSFSTNLFTYMFLILVIHTLVIQLKGVFLLYQVDRDSWVYSSTRYLVQTTEPPLFLLGLSCHLSQTLLEFVVFTLSIIVLAFTSLTLTANST